MFTAQRKKSSLLYITAALNEANSLQRCIPLKINKEFFTLIHSFTQTIQTYTQEKKKQYLSALAISKAPIMLVVKCPLDTENIQLKQTLMSADYCRATDSYPRGQRQI